MFDAGTGKVFSSVRTWPAVSVDLVVTAASKLSKLVARVAFNRVVSVVLLLAAVVACVAAVVACVAAVVACVTALLIDASRLSILVARPSVNRASTVVLLLAAVVACVAAVVDCVAAVLAFVAIGVRSLSPAYRASTPLSRYDSEVPMTLWLWLTSWMRLSTRPLYPVSVPVPPVYVPMLTPVPSDIAIERFAVVGFADQVPVSLSQMLPRLPPAVICWIVPTRVRPVSDETAKDKDMVVPYSFLLVSSRKVLSNSISVLRSVSTLVITRSSWRLLTSITRSSCCAFCV